MDQTANVILDIENLMQVPDKTTGGSPITKALSRKGCTRVEGKGPADLDSNELSKKIIVKGQYLYATVSQLEPLKQSLIPGMHSVMVSSIPNCTCMTDTADGWNKRLGRFAAFNPKGILLLFATLSSIGTLILIYFTLAIKQD